MVADLEPAAYSAVEGTSLRLRHLVEPRVDPVNRLIKLSLLCLITVGAAGCHEARITGPTQCLAPHGFGRHDARVAQASDIVRGQPDLSARTAADTTSF